MQNSKKESDLFRIIDCFFDGYVSVISERVNFSKKFWKFLHKNFVKASFFSFKFFFQQTVLCYFLTKCKDITTF